MAHVHAYGDVCPEARPIIHLGATSCYVTDNTDLMLMRESLRTGRAARLVGRDRPAGPICRGSNAICLAWPIPICNRPSPRPSASGPACGRMTWCRIWTKSASDGRAAGPRRQRDDRHARPASCNCSPATTKRSAGSISWSAARWASPPAIAVTGQTYSRKVDAQVLATLSGIAQSAHKVATDLRLLQSFKEMEEPFEERQIGSSAMAYKRNPMRAERICGLARFVMSLESSAAQTAATQWMERTLDDSANRRLTLPQAFLAVDAVLIL